MTSSCPRATSPSLAVSALGETRMVSSWTRVPRGAWAAARALKKIEQTREIAISQNGNRGLKRDTPPTPSCFGIMELAEIPEKIQDLQSLAGKILSRRDLQVRISNLAMDLGCVVSGSTFALFKSRSFEHGVI